MTAGWQKSRRASDLSLERAELGHCDGGAALHQAERWVEQWDQTARERQQQAPEGVYASKEQCREVEAGSMGKAAADGQRHISMARSRNGLGSSNSSMAWLYNLAGWSPGTSRYNYRNMQ